MKANPFIKLVKYDTLVFFREPFFALPIMLLPGIFFAVFMSIYANQQGSTEGFDIYVPTYALLISFLVLFFNIGMQFVTEKERGIHKRLTLSSISKKYIVGAYLVRGIALSLLGLVEIELLAIFMFDIPISKYFLLFLGAYLLIIGLVLLISISTHDLFKNSKQVLPFTIIVFQYVLFGSGLMYPVSQMPEFLKYVVYINPFYHMNNLLADIWMTGVQHIELKSIIYLFFVALLCFGLVSINSAKKEA